MNPKIDFYILPKKTEKNATKSSAIWVATLLCEKAYYQGFSVHFLTFDESQTSQFNQMLWTFKQNAFIPHSVNLDSDESVIIANKQPIKPTDILINLTNQAINISTEISFKRILEIIEHEQKAHGRKKYISYQENNISCSIHHI